jgi:hypothetical protein
VTRCIVVVAAALALAAGAGVPEARAELSGSNLVEVQSGNYPFRDPENRLDLYDLLQLEYAAPRLRVGARLEMSENSEALYTYREFTQRWAEWSDERVRVRAGNFYTILGRGLLHRSFELPAVVLDELGVRARYAPSRDVDGVLAEGRAGPVDARLFAGRPNGGVHSPAAEEFGLERYEGRLAGAQAGVTIWRESRIGAAYLRSMNEQGASREFGSGFAELDPARLLGIDAVAIPLYVEYAQANRDFGDFFRFRTGDRDTFALYASANLLAGPFGLSAEWKDYRGFRLGFNDPPSLVREHAFALLNRNTHVLDAERERGFQLEGSWTVDRWGTATLNASRADGEGDRYEELYGEVHVAPDGGAVWESTVFMAGGSDAFDFTARRRAWGAAGTVRVRGPWAVSVDAQKQDGTRRFFTLAPVAYSDTYFSGAVSRAGWGSVALVMERSTDPDQEDPDDFLEPGVQPRGFLAAVLSAVLSDMHQATLFVGERRGGRACTAGTCYEVQPFKGAELRLTSRF